MNQRIRRTTRRGFTLIEILIVVVILGILAAIVIPQFTEASDDANASAAASVEQTVRGQLELFRVQQGSYPDPIAQLWNGSVTDDEGNPLYWLPEEPTIPEGYGYTYDRNAVPVYVVTEDE